MISKYAVCEQVKKNGPLQVIAIILWDGASTWTPYAGSKAFNIDNVMCCIGAQTVDGVEWTLPQPITLERA